MSTNTVTGILEKFCQDTCRASRGEQVDPFRTCHKDLAWTMTGSTPVCGTYEGLDAFRAAIGPKLATQFRTGPEFGLYPVECIVEGNRFAMVARGCGEGATGITYNNSYCFFGEIKDGKIFKIIESCDGALVMRSAFNMRLEQAKPEGP